MREASVASASRGGSMLLVPLERLRSGAAGEPTPIPPRRSPSSKPSGTSARKGPVSVAAREPAWKSTSSRHRRERQEHRAPDRPSSSGGEPDHHPAVDGGLLAGLDGPHRR